ncbi:hypothetical protein MPDQ_002360 [Monascus purpureus]|uniref:Zn(2)-C6 fungal-type domain-containing protein n=1 Tax=Monascus purpureus TaxID=5098 RepID=A0A507QPS8_MONPU|nr:hypothetical protein MPDQ_002360 [Monascus purpureus]
MTATSTTAHIGGINKRGQPRRKVILACERCREKKIRCDGANPICSHCRRPGYGIDRCIHRTDSARTAISDEYLKTLHRRIRQLEEACSKAGIAVPPVSTQCESKDPVVSEINPAITVKTVPLSLDGAAQTAYKNLRCNTQEQAELSELNIGLGSAFDSNANPLVLYNALNIMFALGCHFSNDLGPEREELARSFFHRSERLVCLSFLNIGSIGIVQVLLIVALYLQSTSYTGRCWFSIGIACRIAQGLGLHEATVQDSSTLLETEIRRRTWHGCVIIDLIVSMTFGRPSMTSHIPPVPLPSTVSDSELLSDSNGRAGGVGYSLMTFYVSTIELYGILDSIL